MLDIDTFKSILHYLSDDELGEYTVDQLKGMVKHQESPENNGHDKYR